jgi:hypothetical protein
MAEKKDKSPNKDIDKAIKDLMDDMKAENVSPDHIRAKAAVIAIAVKWEQVKHNIKDEGDFDPNAL